MTLRRVMFICLLLPVWSACDRDNSRAALAVAHITVAPRAVQVGTVKEARINEASGVIASRKYEGVFWTHNDGNDGVLYAIRRDGSLIGSIKLDVKVRDWEDIANDDQGNLYIADTGNNSENRRHVFVYKVREPDPAELNGRDGAPLAIQQSWKVEFPGEPADIESLFVWRGQGFLIFKLPDKSPAEMYSFDLDAQEKTVMEKVATLPIIQPVTGADISPDGSDLAVLTRGDLWVFKIDGNVARAPEAPITRIPLPPAQTEGCSFSGSEIVMVSESREVFAAPIPGATTQPAKP